MRYSTWAALAVVALLCGPVGQSAAAGLDLEHYLKRDTFTDIKLSPGGDYYAATVPMEDRTALAIISRANGKVSGTFVPPRNNHASNFYWVSNDRLLIGLAEKFGSLDQPQPTGELYAMNANGGRGELLVGYRVESKGPGTRIQPKKVESVAAYLIDSMPQDERNVLVSIWPFFEDPYTRVDRLDIASGRRQTVARSPVRRAEFTSDPNGQIRFAHGAGSDNVNKLYYR
ncbi:MAG: S9 family peptidase, partial [Stenotrophomonas sp.]